MDLVTESLIYDCICLPIAPYEPLYAQIKHKRILPIAHTLSKELYRLMHSTPLWNLKYFCSLAKDDILSLKITKLLHHSTILSNEELETQRHIYFFNHLEKSKEFRSIHYIVGLLEDNCVLKTHDSIKIWFSSIIHHLLDFIADSLDVSPGLKQVLKKKVEISYYESKDEFYN
jgi:hypothetical protein